MAECCNAELPGTGFQKLNKITDSIGASLGASAGERGLVVSIKCLREDLDLLADLAADLVLRPTFPESEIEKVRGEVLTSLRELRNDTRSVARRAFYPMIYGEGHPYSSWQMGTEETVNSFTRSDLVDFHRSLVGPAGATAIATGAVSFDRLSSLLDSMFPGWESSRAAPDKWDVPPARPPAEPVRRHLVVEGKTQTDVIVGLPVISRRDSDFYALNMADLILGGLGLMGRLGASVRDEQGLAYYVYSSLGVSHGPGAWTVRAGVNPVNRGTSHREHPTRDRRAHQREGSAGRVGQWQELRNRRASFVHRDKQRRRRNSQSNRKLRSGSRLSGPLSRHRKLPDRRRGSRSGATASGSR